MKKKLNQITGLISKSLRFLFFTAILTITLNAQSVTNLEKFYTLVDSASNLLIKDLTIKDGVYLNLDFSTDYSVFNNQIRGKLIRSDIRFATENEAKVKVDFIIDECLVSYGEPRKDGWFGDFYTERTIKLSGNYFISGKARVKDFSFEETDIVKVDDIGKIENRAFPFTKGELPSEPFLSGILEPIVAVGAAAITIILFFSVRSK